MLLGPLLVGWALPAAAAELALRASWQLSAPDADRPIATAEAFDPTRLKAFPRNPDGVWIRLESATGRWPQTPLVLVVRSPPMGAAVLYRSDGGPSQRASTEDVQHSPWQGYGRLAYPLTQPLPPATALLLHFEPYPALFSPVTFAVLTAEDYQAEDSEWLVFASICFTTMIAMSLMALLFAARLGDASFYYYAGYVLSFSLLQGIQSGFAFHPLGWDLIAREPLVWGRMAAGLSVMFATLFLARFAALGHYAPKARWIVLAVGWSLGVTTVLGLLPWPAARLLARELANPLLLLGALVLLVSSVTALWRGSRYAGFFLLGWTPLLGVTALGSAQTFGLLATWTWINNASLAAGALEALLLSLGLADRALALRRERDRAQSLAELDPLTGLLNRRAWIGRLSELAAATSGTSPLLALVFIDLDHFKSVNDCFGHEAGDRALLTVAACLREELRPIDLLGRYGGEEFVVALPHCAEGRAHHVAERLRAAIKALALPVTDGGASLTASIGVAIPLPGESISDALARADQAMYQAKKSGRNRVATARTERISAA